MCILQVASQCLYEQMVLVLLTGGADMMSATLQRFLHVPLAAWSVILGGTVSKIAPCKWCSWQEGLSLGHPLPFGL